MKRCPNCNSECEDANQFCTKCGTFLPQPTFCTKCGARLKEGERFCTRCGSRIENEFSNPTCQNAQNESAQKVKENEIIDQTGLQRQNSQPVNGIAKDTHEAENEQYQGKPDTLTKNSEYFAGGNNIYGEYNQDSGSNKPKIWVGIIIAVVIIGGIVFWLSRQGYIGSREPMAPEDTVENEAVEEAPSEQSMLIATDNIHEEVFSSPDLDFFNVHGPVKELRISYTGVEDGLFGGWCNPGVYKFDKNGRWTNPLEVSVGSFEKVYKVERNDKGQIVKFILSENKDEMDDWHFWETFEWENNCLSEFSYYPEEGHFHYLDGTISLIELEHAYTQYPMEDLIRFSDFEYDEQGNWISCTWRETVTYDTDGDPDIPPTYSSGKMKRKILYYTRAEKL